MTQDEYFRFLADCKPARTGTGGIPAASDSAPLTLGSAECQFYELTKDEGQPWRMEAKSRETVHSIAGEIPPDTWILAGLVKGCWFAVAEFCP
jgi:hypothetical protein